MILITAPCILLCIPAILVAEHFGWTQIPFHLTQLIATALCLISCSVFLVATRASKFGLWQWLASLSLTACILWLGFVAVSYTHLTLPTNRDV